MIIEDNLNIRSQDLEKSFHDAGVLLVQYEVTIVLEN